MIINLIQSQLNLNSFFKYCWCFFILSVKTDLYVFPCNIVLAIL